MFATGIYDVLTPGSLTGGKAIAGTGEIDGEGKVGAIGGIQQKLVGAQDDGARLFLVPADNCAEALGGHYDPDKMRLVKVTTSTTRSRTCRPGSRTRARRCRGAPGERAEDGERTGRRRPRGGGARRPSRAGTSRRSCSPSSTPPTCSSASPSSPSCWGCETGRRPAGSPRSSRRRVSDSLEELLPTHPLARRGGRVRGRRGGDCVPPGTGDSAGRRRGRRGVRRRPPRPQEARIVAGVLRTGESWCAIRQRAHDEDDLVLTGHDLVPALLELLHATLEPEGEPSDHEPQPVSQR